MQANEVTVRFSRLKIRLKSQNEIKVYDEGSLTVNSQYVYFRADLPKSNLFQCGFVPWDMVSSVNYDEL